MPRWRNRYQADAPFHDAKAAAAILRERIVQHPDYVKAKGEVADIDKFDAAFFGIAPREAAPLRRRAEFALLQKRYLYGVASQGDAKSRQICAQTAQ